MSSVVDLAKILAAKAKGRDLIEESGDSGGLVVDDETIKLVSDIETVADIGFEGDVKETTSILIQVMVNAPKLEEPEDPYEAGRDWLDGWLEFDQTQTA